MKLSIKDRMNLPALFPEKSSLITMKCCNDIMKKTEITQEEMKMLNFKATPREQGFAYTWDNKKEKPLTIIFTELELAMLKTRVKELDEAKEITLEMGEVCNAIQDEK